MPKNNIGNKRASSASTKKSGLKRRFDLTNKKVQFFVVIAIVAVLGGGWFTYRSFAAEAVLYTFNGGQLTCTNASCKPGTVSAKNAYQVKELLPGGRLTLPSSYYTNAVYNLCVTATGAGSLQLTGIGLTASGTPSTSQINFFTSQYESKCNKFFYSNGYFDKNQKVEILNTSGQGSVTISNINISRDLPTPTAPAPPAK